MLLWISSSWNYRWVTRRGKWQWGYEIALEDVELTQGDKAQQVNGKADIWSVGCVVSRMLGGQSAGQEDDKVGHPVQPVISMKTHYTHRSMLVYGGELGATNAQQRRVVARGKRLSQPMLPL